MLHDAVVHVPSVSQLQDEVELGGRVDDFVQAHHVGVLHHLHAAHLLEEVAPRHRVQLGLIDHLHCNLETNTSQLHRSRVQGGRAGDEDGDQFTFSPVKTWRASLTTAKCPRPSVLSRSYSPAIFPS